MLFYLTGMGALKQQVTLQGLTVKLYNFKVYIARFKDQLYNFKVYNFNFITSSLKR